MTHKTVLLLTAAILVLCPGLLCAGEPADAVEEQEMVIALVTDEFELDETDISHLDIGDSQTIYTENGQAIDLLRTAEGVEIYVDGELLDVALDGEGLHEGRHVVHHQVDVECDSEEACEETVLLIVDEETDWESDHHGNHHEKTVIIKKEVETN